MSKRKMVVYIDDDKDDLEIFQEVFTQLPGAPELKLFFDTEEALHFLRHTIDETEIYCYILIDVNLRTMNGFELVQMIQSEPRLKTHSIALISTSSRQEDALRAEELHVDYTIKPDKIDGVITIAKKIVEHCSSLEA